MAKNPEVRENQEAPETREELNNLETRVSRDRRKFETLSNDSSLKKWLKKIMEKSLEWKIKTFTESYNKYSKKSVDEYTNDMIKKHPDLISFIGWELKLPVKIWESKNKVNFSQLSFEQKLSFMALVNVYRDNIKKYKDIKPSKIIDNYRKYMNDFIKESTNNFNKEIDKNKNIIWMVDLKKVLKNTYWLTDEESKKVEEYVELIQKHPEYVWWILEKFKMQEAAWDWRSFWNFLKVVVIVWGAIWWLSQFKWCFSIQNPETRVYWDHTEIENFEEIFKIISGVETTDSRVREFHADGLGHVDLWWSFLKPVEWFVNWVADVVNLTGLENRDMLMEVKCKNYYAFDFKWVKCFLQKENWERTVYLKWVKKPEIITDVTDVKILDSKKELIKLKKFDNFEIEAQNFLKEEAKKTASQPSEIKKANESLGKQLLLVFQTLWCHNSEVDVEWKDIKRIVIEYEEDEESGKINQLSVDPENKKTIVTN